MRLGVTLYRRLLQRDENLKEEEGRWKGMEKLEYRVHEYCKRDFVIDVSETCFDID